MRTVVITGGCGFIGCNAAERFYRDGNHVVVLDNLSRPGSSRNLAWLQTIGPMDFVNADVRDANAVHACFRTYQPDVVLHLAAQVAVTTSIRDPRTDFEINALGTFNVLEAARKHCPSALILNSSTNKVYGNLERLSLIERTGRWEISDLPFGVSETTPLDFHSPYGCSKGTADQYVIDYSRIFGLRTINFRQSCIYGQRQFGIEDQGWVAWFLIAHQLGLPITIYGDGKQVRDVLFVQDLLDCYIAAIERSEDVSGETFNIGGGPQNTMSLLEFLPMIEELSGRAPKISYSNWRAGDQPVYISDIRKAEVRLGWMPRTSVKAGVQHLSRWIAENTALFELATATTS